MEGLNSTLMTSSEWKEKYFQPGLIRPKLLSTAATLPVWTHVMDDMVVCLHTVVDAPRSCWGIFIFIFIIAHVYVMFASRVDKCK